MKKTLTALALASGLAGAVQAADRDVVQALYSEVLSGTTSPDLPGRMAKVLSPDWRSIGDYASPVKTRDQFLAQLQRVGGALPNLSWKVEEILQAGNRFVVRGRATATPVAPFMGAPFTGRGFEIMAIDIHTVEDNKIVLSYHVEDWHGALEQLQRR
jgi:predicted ester cyclase